MVLLEARKALLRDLGRLDQWTRVICRRVNKAKVWVLCGLLATITPAELQTEMSGWKAAQQERSWEC